MAVKSIVYKEIAFEIAYDIVNPQISETILFLHGWGSNKEVMKTGFGKVFPAFRHLYIDMPGFGKTPNPNGALSSEDYADVIRIFLNELGTMPIAVFGHSFGGKIATLLNPPTLVLLSSAGIPVEKSTKTKMKIQAAKLLKPLFGVALRKMFASDDAKNMDEAMYETFKKVVDEDFSNAFSTYHGKALIFWGKEDKATPPVCAKRINELIKGSKLFMIDGDHYFFLQKSAEIERLFVDN